MKKIGKYAVTNRIKLARGHLNDLMELENMLSPELTEHIKKIQDELHIELVTHSKKNGCKI